MGQYFLRARYYNLVLCAIKPVIGAEERAFANIQVTPYYKNILMFIENLRKR